MPFDPEQWLAAVDAFHRGQRDGAQQAAAPGSTPAEGKERHCFGCGETYLATHMVWDRFPDPANPYALCRDCLCDRSRHTTDVKIHALELRHISRQIARKRRDLADAMARKN